MLTGTLFGDVVKAMSLSRLRSIMLVVSLSFTLLSVCSVSVSLRLNLLSSVRQKTDEGEFRSGTKVSEQGRPEKYPTAADGFGHGKTKQHCEKWKPMDTTFLALLRY